MIRRKTIALALATTTTLVVSAALTPAGADTPPATTPAASGAGRVTTAAAGDGIPRTDIKRSDLTLVPGKLAEPSDDGPHPGSATEWWYTHVMDPKTKRTFIAMIFTAPLPTALIFWYPEKGQKLVLPELVTEVKATDQPAVRSNVGSLVFDKKRRLYHLKWNGAFAKADIWLEKPLPGVTGGPIKYDNKQTMYWSAPVGTSHAKGWLRPPGSDKRIDVGGWRGYHDHNWGNFNVADQSYSGWEWGVSHEPDGTATLLGGVVKGDGTWQGVVGRVTRKETFGCMSKIKLSNWQVSGLFSYPKHTDVSCDSSLLATPGGLIGKRPALDKRFEVTDPFILDVGIIGLPESLGRTVPGSIGLIEHIRTLRSRITP